MKTNVGKWWHKAIVYEIYVSSFFDSNNDGVGDINGIIKKLDYLKSLNVGAIWLTPVYTSPMKDNGYDVTDYYSINPQFGTMEDMDNLIKEANKRNIKIVIDLVFNHTSNECEWFKKSCLKEGDYQDYYIWQDPKEDGSVPNNWRSIFGGSAWTWCEQRKQYYLHTFLKEQPDLNWNNQKVREEVYKICSFWLNKGIGGFRLDAIPYIKKPKVLKDGIPDSSDGMVDIHKMTCNQNGILDYLHEFKNRVCNDKDIFTVGEANGVPPNQLDKWVGENGVFDMIFDFKQFSNENIWYQRKKKSVVDFKQAMSLSIDSLPQGGYYPIFLENHDLPRSVTSFCLNGTENEKGAKALAAILLLTKGIPFIYQGEELGMTNTTWKGQEYRDPNTVEQYKLALENGLNKEEADALVNNQARDNARTPMQWSNYLNAGFSLVKPWIKINDDYRFINVDDEILDKDSIFNWYRKLSQLRKDNVIICGDYELLLPDDINIYSFKRSFNNRSIIVLINFALERVNYDKSISQNYILKYDSIGLNSAIEGILLANETKIYIGL